MCGKWKRPPERRGDPKRMNGRTDVVREARQCEVGRSHASAYRLIGFEHQDPASGLSQDNGRAQTVRPRSHDDGIEHAFP
jgi:hypothetical protein